MPLKSASIEDFQAFSQFACLKEFNHHIEMWLAVHKSDFSKGELAGLKRLVRFAAKIPGISNAKIGTILKAIHEEYHHHGISRSTFKRMVQKAKNAGIITVHETERKNGSQTSNLYVFNRFPSHEPPKEEKMSHPETDNLLKTEDQKIIKKRSEEATQTELDYTYVSDRIPQAFIQIVKCFFPEAKTIEEYWRMTEIAADIHTLKNETELMTNTGIQAFKQLVRKLKFTHSVKNPIAYYYGIVSNRMLPLYLDKLEELGERAYRKPLTHITLENGELLPLDWWLR